MIAPPPVAAPGSFFPMAGRVSFPLPIDSGFQSRCRSHEIPPT